MIRCHAIRPAESRIEATGLEGALAAHAAGASIWIDLEGVAPADLQPLADRIGLHPLAVADVFNPETRPKVEEYDSFLFVVATAMHLGDGDFQVLRTNLHLFLGDRFLVTARREPMPALAPLLQAAERGAARCARPVDLLLHACLDAVVDDHVLLLDEVRARQDRLEAGVLSTGRAAPRWEAQLFLSRKLLGTLQRLVSWQRHALDGLVFDDVERISPEARTHLRDVLDHAVRVDDELGRQRDLLADLMTAHFARVSQRTNETVKVLTVVTTLMMPLAFITGVFGMNFEHIPGLDSPAAFWGTMAFMALVVVGGVLLMRRLRIL